MIKPSRFQAIVLLSGMLMAVILGFPAVSAAAESGSIGVNIDGQAVNFGAVQPFADENGRVLVPVRPPLEAMGVTVEWIQSAQQFILTKNGTRAVFQIGSSQYFVNDVPQQMDTMAVANNGNSMIPIRYAVECFGASVSWVQNPPTVTISTTPSQAVNNNQGTTTNPGTDTTEDHSFDDNENNLPPSFNSGMS